MGRFIAAIMLSSMTFAQLSFADAKPEQNSGVQSVSPMRSAPGVLATLPPVPSGKTTVIGGAIRNVDPVRDQVTLKVFGGRPMKILFDERTQVYRDGKKIPLRDLRPEDHASIETVLDGTNIFALSIRILSRPPEGEYEGKVLNYNPATRELTVGLALSRKPIELRVPTGTPIVRRSQAASSAENTGPSDLVRGDLVSVKFEPGNDNKGRGVASQIAILATPGSAFVFSGNVTFLDLHSQLLVLANPQDGKSYRIFFDPARFSASRDIHEGAHVTVIANFDGDRYVANKITVN